ncbi:unnamed protein product [Pylaiella littoralis]
MWATYNDGLALKALSDGVVWTATDYVRGQWVEKEDCTAGPVCRDVLRDFVKVLPLESAFAEDAAAGSGGGEPHGYKEWRSTLGFSGCGVPPDDLTWHQRVSLTLPSSSELGKRYEDLLGCGRPLDTSPCSSPTCSLCWRNRNQGLVHDTVWCFNHRGQAPEVASAGMRKLRGGPVEEAGRMPSTWVLSRASRGNGIELFVSAAAARDGTTGVGHSTVARVIFYFEHLGKDQRSDEDGHVQEGVVTVWVAVLEYVTAGRAHQRKEDPATGFDVFTIRSHSMSCACRAELSCFRSFCLRSGQ